MVFLKGVCSGLYFFCCISTILLKHQLNLISFYLLTTQNLLCENEELTKVSDWLIANKLTLNIIKIKLFYFSIISEKGNLKIANQIF